MEFVIFKVGVLPVEERDRELHIRYVCSEIERSKHEISGIKIQDNYLHSTPSLFFLFLLIHSFQELTKSLEDQKLRHRTEANELSDQVTVLMETWQNINNQFNNQLAKTL